jgi:hypothetical protein
VEHSRRVSAWVVGAVLAALMAAACTGTSVFDLEVGDCIEDPHATEEFREIGTVQRVDCSEPHYGRVLTLFDVEDSEFPGMDELDSIANERCPSGTTDILVPSERSWNEAGDREIICVGQ